MGTSKPEIRDGFELLRTGFDLSTTRKLEDLDPQGVTDVLICELFLSRKLAISDIISLSNKDYQTVVQSLLKQGIVRDRRQNRGQQPPNGVERRQQENE